MSKHHRCNQIVSQTRVAASAARPPPRPEAEPVLEQDQGLAAISCYVACETSRLPDHL
jgi:hypothetical protein